MAYSPPARWCSARAFLPVQAAAATTSDATWQPSVYLGLEPDGRVIIIAHRSEMGTGIRTSLPMIVAEELEADWARVKIEQAIGDKKYGSQDTDGSESIRDFYDPMREAGATARMMLESAAASKWGVPVAECQAKNHEVVHAKTDRKLGFGELVPLAAKQPVPKKEQLKFKSPAEYRYVGKNVPIADLDDILAGHAVFGMDARVPGMVYASIERPPVFGGKLKSYDDAEARKVRGVSKTLTIPPFKPPYGFQPLGGVAVIADNTWAAMQGRRKLKMDWELGPNASLDSVAYKKTLQETARKACKVARNDGDVDAAFKKATKVHEAEYYVPHLAHASMEPPVAVAEFKNGKVEAWAPTQNPQAVQDTVAKALGIKPADVTLPRDAAGRRLRAQIKTGLRRRSGHSLQATWQAGEGGVEPRGRHPLRLLSRGRGHVHEGGHRRKGPAHGLAAAQRFSAHRIAGRCHGQVRHLRAGHGLERCSVRYSQLPRRVRTGGHAHSHRLDAIGGQYSARVRRAVLHR